MVLETYKPNKLTLFIMLLALTKAAVAFNGDEAQIRMIVRAFGIGAEGFHDGIINDSLTVTITLDLVVLGDSTCVLTVDGNTIQVKNVQFCPPGDFEIEVDNIDWANRPSAYLSKVVIETHGSPDNSTSSILVNERSFRYIFSDPNDWNEDGILRLRLESNTASVAIPAFSLLATFVGVLLLGYLGFVRTK